RYVLLAFIRYAAAAIHNAQQRVKVTRSEERYRLAASLTSDAIYEWIIGDTRVDWSGDIDNLLRYNAGEFPRTVEAWLDVIHPNDKKRVQIAREATVRDGSQFEEEYRMRRSDGTYCYVLDRAARLDSAPTVRVLGAISDLTNTYELTDALVESEVRYRTLFALWLDAIFVTDAHGLLLDFNPAAEALTGRDYGQLVSASFQQLVPHSNLPDYYNALKWLAERGEVSNFEIRLSRPDNSVVEVEMWGAALGGGMYQFVARDVSVRKQNQIMAAQRVAELTALSDVTRTTTAGGDIIDMLNRALPVAMGALEMPLGCIYLYEAATESLRRVAEIGPTLMPETLTMSAVSNGRLT